MRRVIVVAGVLFALAAAVWAAGTVTTDAIFTSTIKATGSVTSVVAASTPTRKVFTASTGTGANDTLAIYEGFLTLADEGVATLVTGLDSSSTFQINLAHITTNNAGIAGITVNVNIGAVLDTTVTGNAYVFFSSGTTACTGTSGSNGRITLCRYTTGATVSFQVENQLAPGYVADICWEVRQGGY
uniref:Uncharacterized protein n=1 Tax=viral metagenome TaxID=1070528 RepID=A0A6M3IME7_9ZZZZ